MEGLFLTRCMGKMISQHSVGWNSAVPVSLLISPPGQRTQSKQHSGLPFCTAFLVPAGQGVLQIDTGTYILKKDSVIILHYVHLLSHTSHLPSY